MHSTVIRRHRTAGGFTLVEILIVTLVLSLFLLGMAFLLKGGMKLFAVARRAMERLVPAEQKD